MSSVVLGSTTVLSETGGVVTVQSGTKFPPGHIIQTFGNYSNVSYSFDPDANWVELGGTDATKNLRVTINNSIKLYKYGTTKKENIRSIRIR